MNEFDELFDKTKNPKDPQADKKIDDYYKNINLQRRNGLIIAIYFGVILLFGFISQVYKMVKYPDSQSINDNITMVSQPSIYSTESSDANNPYKIVFNVDLQNNNDIDLPAMNLIVTYIDSSGKEFTATFSQENIAAGDIANFSDSFNVAFDPVSYTFSYGFDEASMYYSLMNLLPIVLAAALIFLVDFQSFKYDWQRFKGNLKAHLSKILGGYIIVLATLALSTVLMNLLGVSGTSENEVAIRSMFEQNTLQMVLLFLLLVVFTPIVEETVFRKVIYNFIEPRFNHTAAIISTGVIFGLMHVLNYGDFIQAIPYVAMGIAFGYLYYWSKKNIWVTIGAHVINNLVNFVIYVLATYGLYQL